MLFMKKNAYVGSLLRRLDMNIQRVYSAFRRPYAGIVWCCDIYIMAWGLKSLYNDELNFFCEIYETSEAHSVFVSDDISA